MDAGMRALVEGSYLTRLRPPVIERLHARAVNVDGCPVTLCCVARGRQLLCEPMHFVMDVGLWKLTTKAPRPPVANKPGRTNGRPGSPSDCSWQPSVWPWVWHAYPARE